MRPGQNKRLRGRNNRKGPNPLTRSYESNGPDVKVRGTAQHIAEKYLQLARDAQSSGDPVMAESYLQHAEHYYRLIAAAHAAQQAQFAPQNSQPRPTAEPDYDEEEEDIANDRFASVAERLPQPQFQQIRIARTSTAIGRSRIGRRARSVRITSEATDSKVRDIGTTAITGGSATSARRIRASRGSLTKTARRQRSPSAFRPSSRRRRGRCRPMRRSPTRLRRGRTISIRRLEAITCVRAAVVAAGPADLSGPQPRAMISRRPPAAARALRSNGIRGAIASRPAR